LDRAGELIEPFTMAVSTTLREMAGAEAVVRGLSRAASDERFADVSVGLRLEAEAGEWVVLSLPLKTAAVLSARVLGDSCWAADEAMVWDCVAELLNVIAGQAKALTFGTPNHFTFSTPVPLSDPPAGVESGAVIRFGSDAGDFALHLYLTRVAVSVSESPIARPGG
jgi:chemotaxis protein CheX